MEAKFSKNYLLVPLSKVDDAEKAQYKLDFEIIESTVNEKHWVSVQDYIDVQRYRQSLAKAQDEESLGYAEIQRQLKDCIFFNRFQRSKCFSIYEVIPSMVEQDGERQKIYPEHEDGFNLAESIKHRFKDEQDLQSYILKTVFGRKKAFSDGTSLQDWLYLHPNKLSSIREIRESIQKMACLVEEEYEGPEILHKILNADLLITEDIKTINSNGQHRFAFKFAPLPLHPDVYRKKSDLEKKKKKKQNEENLKQSEPEAKHAG